MESTMESDSDSWYEPESLFEQTFRSLSFSRYKKPHLETGDKIIMPPSSLRRILSLQIEYPLIFKIEGFNSDKTSHCGVLEFDAEEGFIHVPEWMMRNLNLREGAFVILRSVSLSRGSYMKLQPHTTSFIELTDPKAVLEKTMRGFSCLSRGDTIMVRHGCRDFYLDMLDVGPGDAISLIDCDCHLDFSPPLDYLESSRKRRKTLEEVNVEKVVDRGEKVEEGKVFRPFMGRGQRLDGEAVVERSEGKKSEKDGGKEKFKAFTGRSYVLGGL